MSSRRNPSFLATMRLPTKRHSSSAWRWSGCTVRCSLRLLALPRINLFLPRSVSLRRPQSRHLDVRRLLPSPCFPSSIMAPSPADLAGPRRRRCVAVSFSPSPTCTPVRGPASPTCTPFRVPHARLPPAFTPHKKSPLWRWTQQPRGRYPPGTRVPRVSPRRV